MDVTTSLEHAIQIFINTGFSRVPVYDDTIDNIVGLIYAKDILNLVADDDIEGKVVRDLVRSAYFVPESKPADELLREMQARKVHMAIVVDEYGGTSGIVTIENLIEEIIGDIRDEYDQNEQYEYIRNSDDEYIIDASMDLDDVNELLDTSFDTSETDTLGGFIYQSIGRVPIVGETIETDELTLRVRSLEGRRIRKVLVKLKPRPQDDDKLTIDEERLADAS
jgi:CBS domain containing-hemolysin-like protein